MSREPYTRYDCSKKMLYPPKNFIKRNDSSNEYRTEIPIDECLADEIEDLWSKGINTTGCCCGHGYLLGYIEVVDECIKTMEELGYCHYIYPDIFGGSERKDAFIPKSYGHKYVGFVKSQDGYWY